MARHEKLTTLAPQDKPIGESAATTKVAETPETSQASETPTRRIALAELALSRASIAAHDLAAQQQDVERQIDQVQADGTRALAARTAAALEFDRHWQRCQAIDQELATARTAASIYGDEGGLAANARARIEALEDERRDIEQRINAYNESSEERSAEELARLDAMRLKLEPLHERFAGIHLAQQRVTAIQAQAQEEKRRAVAEAAEQLVSDAEQDATAAKTASVAAQQRVLEARRRAMELLEPNADTPELRELAQRLAPERPKAPRVTLLEAFEQWIATISSLEGTINPREPLPASPNRTLLDVIMLTQTDIVTLLDADTAPVTRLARQYSANPWTHSEGERLLLQRRDEIESVRLAWGAQRSTQLPLSQHLW